MFTMDPKERFEWFMTSNFKKNSSSNIKLTLMEIYAFPLSIKSFPFLI